MKPFDPNATLSMSEGIFGLPHSAAESKVHLIPVPWEVTTSFRGGTSEAPAAVLRASPQLDLLDPEFTNAYVCGIHMHAANETLRAKNAELKPKAQKVIYQREHHGALDLVDEHNLEEINEACVAMERQIEQLVSQSQNQGKTVGLIGGDHSVAVGSIASHVRAHGELGVLQIDAHADLRKSYQGFDCSHASAMYRVMESDFAPTKLVQVGIRDFCEEEWERIDHDPKIACFLDRRLQAAAFDGVPWSKQCDQIVSALPEKNYVTIDVDGLHPSLAPSTGTPVPGGLNYTQLVHLFAEIHRQGKQIVGFDLCEVAPGAENELDAIIGARILYQLCGWSLVSQGHHPYQPIWKNNIE